MNRSYYLELAAAGSPMPIGTHLILHEQADPDAVVLEGERLGAVVVEAARRFGTPLAVPLMDLSLEKEALLRASGVSADEIEGYHFSAPPAAPADFPLTPRMAAACAAIRHVARESDLLPMGMAIGPFSLMTKLVADPITPVYLAGTGLTASDEPEIAIAEQAIAVGERVIARYLTAQIAAGARAVVICEPAANSVYFSPRQMTENPSAFDRFVMAPMQRVARLLAKHDVDLVFHDCGELTDAMVSRFAALDPVILSLGSSRRLWEDAALVPKHIVLYGNLPSKRFYDRQFTAAEVELRGRELCDRMRATGHPFILGTECDVLSVAGAEGEIMSKVHALLGCDCSPSSRTRAGERMPK